MVTRRNSLDAAVRSSVILEETAHLSVGDNDATDGVVRAIGDESEPQVFERGLSAPTRERPQIGDIAGASLELDGGQQGARNTSAPSLGVNEQHVDQTVWQQVREAHCSVIELSDEGERFPASDIPTAQIGAAGAGPRVHLLWSVDGGCCQADSSLEDVKGHPDVIRTPIRRESRVAVAM